MSDHPNDQLSEEALLKKDVRDAMLSVSDPAQRVVLMLLQRGLESINNKLDHVLSDEAKIKTIVLNGGAATHPEEHLWLRDFQKEWIELSPVVSLMKTRHANGGHCEYAGRMIKAEEKDTDSKRAIRDGLLKDILKAVLFIAIGILAAGVGFKP